MSKEHPAILLGQWLKAKRKEKNLLARIFATEIRLTPAEYSEVEAGVTDWLDAFRIRLVRQVLELTDTEFDELKRLVESAGKASQLKFEDVYSRDQLTPMRLRRKVNRQASERDVKVIVDAVFTPLR